VWDAFVDRVDADSSKLNERLNRHWEQHNEMRRWRRSTEEIDALEMNLASLISRVNQMEDKLCRCGEEKVLSSFALSLASTSDEFFLG